MNRDEYLSELYGRLRQRMPGAELDHIMKYYEEYFDEAGAEREQEIIAELGTPEDLARQIMSGRGVNAQPEYRYERPMPRRWTAGKVILVICLFPIWLPLIIAIPVTAVALVIGIGAGGLGCIAGGIFSAWCGFTALFTPGFTTTMFFCGFGLVIAAIGVLLLLGAVAAGVGLFKALAALCRWIFVGGRRGAAV